MRARSGSSRSTRPRCRRENSPISSARASRASGTRVVVIDSLNGYMNAMPEERFLVLQMHELLSYLNQLGVITILVLAQHGLIGTDADAARYQLSERRGGDAAVLRGGRQGAARAFRGQEAQRRPRGRDPRVPPDLRGRPGRPAAYRVSGHSFRRAELPRWRDAAAADRKPRGSTTRPVERADSDRVLVLAPTGRDSKVACALLEQAGLRCATCSAIGELRRNWRVAPERR